METHKPNKIETEKILTKNKTISIVAAKKISTNFFIGIKCTDQPALSQNKKYPISKRSLKQRHNKIKIKYRQK